jgi:hypothetical protein
MKQEEFNKHFNKELQEIIDKIYSRTLSYEAKIKADNHNSILIASEFMFAILVAVDMLLFDKFGSRIRDSIIDVIVPNVLRGYVNIFIKDETISLELYEKLESNYNQRLFVYSKCELNFKGMMPGKGTFAFAMSYYMHQLKNNNPLNNELDILTGASEINPNDMDSLPDMFEVMKNHFELIASMKEYEIHKNINNIEKLFS